MYYFLAMCSYKITIIIIIIIIIIIDAVGQQYIDAICFCVHSHDQTRDLKNYH